MSTRYDRDFPALPSKKLAKKLKENPPPKSSIATINNVPDEIILEILEHLRSRGPKDVENSRLLTFVSLSRVNRRFHRIVAEPLLSSYDSSFCEPYLFLRTLSSSSPLAALVKDLKFHDEKDDYKGPYNRSAQEKKIVKEGMRALDIPEWKKCAEKCNMWRAPVKNLHSAILMHTRNLHTLTFRGANLYPEWVELIKKIVNGVPYGRMHRFEHLHTIDAEVEASEITLLVPLFQLRSLRRLVLRQLNTLSAEKQAELITGMRRLLLPQSNQLETLKLYFDWTEMDILQILVASCQHLQTLKIDMDVSHMLNTKSDFQKMRQVLSSQKASLRSLEISPYSPDEDHNMFVLYLGTSLQDYPALKHLHCPLSLLMGEKSYGKSYGPASFYEVLPPALGSFTTSVRPGKVDYSLLEGLEQLVAADPASNPYCHLKEMIVYAPLKGKMFTYDWNALVEKSKAANLNLSFVQDPEYDFIEDDWYAGAGLTAGLQPVSGSDPDPDSDSDSDSSLESE